MATGNCRKRRRIDDDSEEEEEAINPKPSPISNLGDDVLAEVLIRAPEPGSAWRCKAVCKRWNSLISDPQFIRRFISHHHRQQSSGEFEEPPLISTFSRGSILSFLPLPDGLKFEQYRFVIFDSYKDLVLCGFLDGLRCHAELARYLFLCNPFTKQWIALPLAPRAPSASGVKKPRLVCEPRDCIELDLGEGRPPFIYSSAYRFRVVCIHELSMSTRIDVFCSESGEWTKEALVLDWDFRQFNINTNVVCNGRLVWLRLYSRVNQYTIVGFNPFRLDIPPTQFDASQLVGEENWNISVSQGGLHLITLGPAFFSVWRQEEDRKSWTLLHKTLVRCDDYELKDCKVVALHPDKPHIVFFERCRPVGHDRGLSVILSYDMKMGELRFFDDYTPSWMVFQPRVSCWPTPIPKYEELRGIYDGRHSCWVQQSSSSKATTLSLNNCGRVVKRRIRQWLDRCSGWFSY